MSLSHHASPAMTRADLEHPRGAGVHVHEHAVALFDDEKELATVLGKFVREGVERNDVCVFVHSFAADDEAWRFLDQAYGGNGPPRRDVILVSLYTQAFQGEHPHIDHEHVAAVVGSITKRAQEGGHAGARIFVDASRRYLGSARADEWFAFESWLGRRLQASVGLVCAYQRGDVLDPANTARVLETHAYRFG